MVLICPLPKYPWKLDKAAALLVGIFVVKAGMNILIQALRVLLDASIDFETMDLVKTIILKDPKTISINEIRGRNSGPFKFIEADIVIKAGSLEKAYLISQKIEREIRQNVSHVDHILIHYEPQKKEMTTCAFPLNSDKMLLADHFGSAPYFYIATRREKDGVLVAEAYHRNPIGENEKGRGIKISEWLLEKGVDQVYTPQGFDGKGPGYVFSDAGVEVIVAKEKVLKDIKKSLQDI